MKGILVVAFWCWFAVSLVVLFRRGVRKASGPGKTSASAAPDTVAAPLLPPISEAPREPLRPQERDVIAPADAPSRTGSLFVREPAAPSSEGTTAVRAATIADALQGIRMPCDLMPLTGNRVDFERRAAFVTVGYPAAAVAPEVADELERLGMSFNAISETTAIAERDDVRVKVAVRSVGPAVNGVPDPDYPTAPEHSVVVEFELA